MVPLYPDKTSERQTKQHVKTVVLVKTFQVEQITMNKKINKMEISIDPTFDYWLGNGWVDAFLLSIRLENFIKHVHFALQKRRKIFDAQYTSKCWFSQLITNTTTSTGYLTPIWDFSILNHTCFNQFINKDTKWAKPTVLKSVIFDCNTGKLS